MRLLIALLCLCLALPATVAPVCAREAPAAMTGMAMTHDAPADHRPTAPTHQCIGCVPPDQGLRADLAAPLAPAAPAPVWAVATLATGPRNGPLLPPPRRG